MVFNWPFDGPFSFTDLATCVALVALRLGFMVFTNMR